MEHTAIFATFLLAGLTASLHCVGMCGPILLALFPIARSRGATGEAPRLRELVAWHGGRLWTYTLLGLLAGLASSGLRRGALEMGWQREASLLTGATIAISGLLLLGVLPGLPVSRVAARCLAPGARRSAPLRALQSLPGPLPTLLLGALMGFLPCGVVYAMLLASTALSNPLEGAMAMTLFGLGTIPSLGTLQLSLRLVPATFRAHGTRAVAALLVVGGVFIVARALLVTTDAGGALHCH